MQVTLIHNPISFSELSNNSIALDGAVRGTHLDINNNRWSFDHHDAAQHSISTRSTALQTLLALRAGLDVSKVENVLVSSIDADSVVATALVMKPQLSRNYDVINLVTLHLDTIDSMGPSGALSDSNLSLHFSLKAGFKEELTTELLLQKVEMFYSLVKEDRLFESSPDRKSPVTLVSISPDGRNVTFDDGDYGFADLYRSANIGILYNPERVTIGIKSSFVTSKNLLTDGLFDRLNQAEIAAGAQVNEDGTIVNGWGGKDLVGGSPFKGVTMLSAQEVANIVCDFLRN
jgi:hypothetical protein